MPPASRTRCIDCGMGDMPWESRINRQECSLSRHITQLSDYPTRHNRQGTLLPSLRKMLHLTLDDVLYGLAASTPRRRGQTEETGGVFPHQFLDDGVAQ